MRKHVVTTSIIFVMLLSIATFSKPTPNKLKPLPTKEIQTQTWVTRDERSYHMRVSRAYSRYANASASTSTSLTPTTAVNSSEHISNSQAHKSSHPVTTAQSHHTESVGDIWSALARCESGMNQRATSKSGTYLGYFQFSMATWHSVGGPGDPRDSDYDTQVTYAQKLQARSGWGQWPACSRKLGLR